MKVFVDRPSSTIARVRAGDTPISSSEVDQFRMTEKARRALNATIAAFAGAQGGDSAFEVEIDLKACPPRGRPTPQTPAEFYETRLSIEDLVRPLLLPEIDVSPLRQFQKKGVAWLRAVHRGILADDMGLGKTVQAIFALRELIREGGVRQGLIVCPGILVPNWVREVRRWAPELGVCVMRPPARVRAEAWKIMSGRMHILISTYEQLRATAHHLAAYQVDVLILDEAHRLRNPQSKSSLAIRQIECDFLWALTGTPIERRPTDLVALLSIVVPGRISRSTPQLGKAVLRSASRPYLLRRNKREVLSELPEGSEHTVWLELTPEQRRAYILASQTDAKETPLARLGRLRRICDLEPASHSSSKIDFLTDRTEEIVRGLSEKAVIFSLTLSPLVESQKRLSKLGISARLLTGRLSLQERDVVLREFKLGPPSVLLASAKLASEGLTLTEANHVFFLNLWWNPSANYQARDRVLRIGQSKAVSIWNLLCADTVDEELFSILQRKESVYTSITDMLAHSSLI